MKKEANVVFRITQSDRDKLNKVLRLDKVKESEFMRALLHENFKLRDRKTKLKI
jgi:hypothetical protein